MLRSKDSAGLNIILQMPVAPWPEFPHIQNFDPYQHFLPYLLDTPSSQTKWSYGMSWWQKEFQQQLRDTKIDDKELVPKAVSIGFDGILIEKSAYSAVLRQLGCRQCRKLPITDAKFCKLYRFPSSPS